MAAYDAFLVELFQYTGKDTLKDFSYEELSRATNKVCKQIYGAKPTEDQKKEQANIKRKVKMEWKKENETEEGLIKTSMYEEKPVVEDVEPEQEPEKHEQEEQAQKAVDEPRQIAAEEYKKEVADEDIKQEEDEQQGPAEYDHAHVLPARKPEDYKTIELELSFFEEENEMLKAHNLALKLAHQKLSGLIDGLCIGSSIVLGGLLAVLLVYKFL